jgi:hypothetical protein
MFRGLTLLQQVKSVLLRISSAISSLVSLKTVKQPHGFQYVTPHCQLSVIRSDATTDISHLLPSPLPSSLVTRQP